MSEHFFGSPSTLGAALVSDTEADAFDDDFYYAQRERLDADIVIFDGRRCPAHPHVVISSPCGMFDGLCDLCEGACSEAFERDEAERREAERHAREGSACTVVAGCAQPYWCRLSSECNGVEIPF